MVCLAVYFFSNCSLTWVKPDSASAICSIESSDRVSDRSFPLSVK